MSKRGRPAKAEVFYVLNNRSRPVADVAKDLDRTEKFVTDILNKHQNTETVEESFPTLPNAKELMAKQNGAVMMTEGASMKEVVNVHGLNTQECIFRPNE